jgi:beta-glucosidase
MKELVAFSRISLAPGESKEVELEVPFRRFALWDAAMKHRVEEGWFEVWLGRNANEKVTGGRVYVAAGDLND